MSDPRTGGVAQTPSKLLFSWRLKSPLSDDITQPHSNHPDPVIKETAI